MKAMFSNLFNMLANIILYMKLTLHLFFFCFEGDVIPLHADLAIALVVFSPDKKYLAVV